MTTNGWTWDAESHRWYVQRGSVRVTARMPRDIAPMQAADIFAAQLMPTSRALDSVWEVTEIGFGSEPDDLVALCPSEGIARCVAVAALRERRNTTWDLDATDWRPRDRGGDEMELFAWDRGAEGIRGPAFRGTSFVVSPRTLDTLEAWS